MPSIETFSSPLTGRKISGKLKHEHVLNLWNKFEMKTINYYHELYLKCDVLLLANGSKKFRIAWFRLCPSHYLNAPGLTWDATLKMKKSELDLIPDPDIFVFFEKSTRGGIYYTSNR